MSRNLAQAKAKEGKPNGALAPNRDRLTVGVDLEDQWSNYCILRLEGETLAEGQLRTTREDLTAFFKALAARAAHSLTAGGLRTPESRQTSG